MFILIFLAAIYICEGATRTIYGDINKSNQQSLTSIATKYIQHLVAKKKKCNMLSLNQ